MWDQKKLGKRGITETKRGKKSGWPRDDEWLSIPCDVTEKLNKDIKEMARYDQRLDPMTPTRAGFMERSASTPGWCG